MADMKNSDIRKQIADLQKELTVAEDAARQIKEQMKEAKRLKIEKKRELEDLSVEFKKASYEYGEASERIKKDLALSNAALSTARKEADIAIRRRNQSPRHRRENNELIRNVKSKSGARDQLRLEIRNLHMKLKQEREKMEAAQAEIRARQEVASPIYQKLKAQFLSLHKQYNNARRRCSELRRQIENLRAESQPGQ